MYPWATKEYLLWDMSLGQIIMYLSIGAEQKYGKNDAPPTLKGKSHAELAEIREQMIRDGLIDDEPDQRHEEMKSRYGAIEGGTT